jgi:hypothetical protein
MHLFTQFLQGRLFIRQMHVHVNAAHCLVPTLQKCMLSPQHIKDQHDKCIMLHVRMSRERRALFESGLLLAQSLEQQQRDTPDSSSSSSDHPSDQEDGSGTCTEATADEESDSDFVKVDRDEAGGGPQTMSIMLDMMQPVAEMAAPPPPPPGSATAYGALAAPPAPAPARVSAFAKLCQFWSASRAPACTATVKQASCLSTLAPGQTCRLGLKLLFRQLTSCLAM